MVMNFFINYSSSIIFLQELTAMLKKGDTFLQGVTANRKGRFSNDRVPGFSEANKENLSSKSMFEQVNEVDTTANKPKAGQQSNYGSTMVSPTFQSNNVISLKDDLFKQNKNYVEVNLSLRDLNKGQEKGMSGKKRDFNRAKNEANVIVEETEEQKYYQERQRLLEHYRSKKYWSKIQKLFEQQNIDPVLAWEDSINRYKNLKEDLQHSNQQNDTLRKEILIKNQKIISLEKNIAQDKNQTRVLSQKKCKGCQSLEQKQKEYFELYEQNKKQIKQIKDLEDSLTALTKQHNKMEQKYLQEKGLKEQMEKKRALLKQDLQKKSSKLAEKEKNEKQLANELQRYQGQDRKNSKLHIECQQLKEFKYQAQKTMAKVQEKYKKQMNQLQQKIKQIDQQRQIYQQQTNKLRNQLSELKPKVLKNQFQLQNERSSLIIKINQCQELKKKHIDNMTQQIKKRNELETSLRQKEEEIIRAYQLIDQAQSMKVKLQFQLSHQRKNCQDKDEEMGKYIQVIKQLESRCKQDEYDSRIKQTNQFFNLARTKNPNVCNIQQNGTPSNSTYNKKVSNKISEIYYKMRDINEQSVDSQQRRKSRESDSEDRDYMSAFQLQKYVNYIHSELSRFINRFEYIQREKDILRRKTQDELECKQSQLNQMKKQVCVKEKVISSIVSFIPEDMKDEALDFLQFAQCYSTRENQEQMDLDQELEERRESLQQQGRQWREKLQMIKFKLRKMEDDMHRLQEENEELKRKTRGKQIKKGFPTDYDCYRDVSKKDIRKKYNFD